MAAEAKLDRKKIRKAVSTKLSNAKAKAKKDSKRAITSFVPVTSEPSPFGKVEGGFDINAN